MKRTMIVAAIASFSALMAISVAKAQPALSPIEEVQTLDPDKMDFLPRGLVQPKALNSHLMTSELGFLVPEAPGKVLRARYLVLEDGTVGAVEILSSTGLPVLDNAAVAWFKTWRFEPATVVGKVVRIWNKIEVRWPVFK